MQAFCHDLTSGYRKIHVSTPSHAESNVGGSPSCWKYIWPLTNWTILLTHPSGSIHMCHLLNCCQRQMFQLPCYQANHTIHALKISFGNRLLSSDVGFHQTMYRNFENYLYHLGYRLLCLWIQWLLIAEGEPLFSCTNPYTEPDLLVQEVEPSDHDKGVNLPHVGFVTTAYVTPIWEAILTLLSIIWRIFSHMLSQTAHRHLEDNQFQTLFGEHLNTPFDGRLWLG